MIRLKPTYFRNSLDLRDKVQVKVLRKRLKLTDAQFAEIVRKSGNSISAISKGAGASPEASPGTGPEASPGASPPEAVIPIVAVQA